MSRFIRIEPCRAREPVEGMRILGRTTDGRRGLIEVYDVSGGLVYFTRSGFGRLRKFWSFLEDWAASIDVTVAAGQVLAVRVPKAPAEADHA